jgi:hypothetical protein
MTVNTVQRILSALARKHCFRVRVSVCQKWCADKLLDLFTQETRCGGTWRLDVSMSLPAPPSGLSVPALSGSVMLLPLLQSAYSPFPSPPAPCSPRSSPSGSYGPVFLLPWPSSCSWPSSSELQTVPINYQQVQHGNRVKEATRMMIIIRSTDWGLVFLGARRQNI